MSRNSAVDLVDDDPSVLRALSRVMRSHGFQVRSFGSGLDFLKVVEDSPPDCVVLDVQMPEMSGMEVFAQVSARSLKLPVIFITAHEDSQTEQLALSSGASAFLYKPLHAATLCSAIRAALEAAPSSAGEP